MTCLSVSVRAVGTGVRGRASVRLMNCLVLIGVWLVAACAPGIDPTPSAVVPPSSSSSSSARPSPISPSPSEAADVFAGVVEVRPDDWFRQADLDSPVGFPKTFGEVYGPDKISV